MKEFDKLGKWQVISEQNVLSNKWIKVRNVTFKLPNDKIMEDYFIVKRSDAVVIIPIVNGKTYLIREYERGVDEVSYKFPSGMIDKGEKPTDAAHRELGEEMGVRSLDLQYLGESFIDPGNLTKRAHYFITKDVQDDHTLLQNNPFELFEEEWVDIKKVDSMIKNNEIKNPYIIVAWTLAQTHL